MGKKSNRVNIDELDSPALQNIIVTKTSTHIDNIHIGDPEDMGDRGNHIEYQEDKLVNELTLKYLMNKDTYRQYMEERREEDEYEFKKDVRFYRKRIFHLVKMLLLTSQERDLYLKSNDCDFDISKIFDNVHDDFQQFLKNVIGNFKSIDICDVIQEENYIEYEKEPYTEISDYVDKVQKQYRMDNFLIIHKKENEIILPHQKEINLSDKKYKKKGLRKKAENIE